MENLKNKLQDGMDAVLEMVNDTHEMFPNLKTIDCFPISVYRTVEIDGKQYQLKMNFEVKECQQAL